MIERVEKLKGLWVLVGIEGQRLRVIELGRKLRGMCGLGASRAKKASSFRVLSQNLKKVNPDFEWALQPPTAAVKASQKVLDKSFESIEENPGIH